MFILLTSLPTTLKNIHGLLISQTLRRSYGWPDNFRAEAWRRDRERVENAAYELAEELIQHKHGMDDEFIKRWRRDNVELPDLDILGTEGND